MRAMKMLGDTLKLVVREMTYTEEKNQIYLKQALWTKQSLVIKI